MGAACDDFKKVESSLSAATIRDYYRKGITEMEDGNARFALRVDATAKRLAEDGHSDPLEGALAREARRDGQLVAVSRMNYERGKRRLAKLGK